MTPSVTMIACSCGRQTELPTECSSPSGGKCGLPGPFIGKGMKVVRKMSERAKCRQTKYWCHAPTQRALGSDPTPTTCAEARVRTVVHWIGGAQGGAAVWCGAVRCGMVARCGTACRVECGLCRVDCVVWTVSCVVWSVERGVDRSGVALTTSSSGQQYPWVPQKV
jgi:hypothetical protein